MTAFVFDCETTGGDPDEVIELAYVEWPCDPISVDPGKDYDEHAETYGIRFECRYKPIHPITYGAMAVHNIVDSDLDDCPPSTSAVLPHCEYIIGHNVDFDWRMVGEPNVKRICTLALARMLYPNAGSHTLGAMAYRLLGPGVRDRVRKCHSAMDDTMLTINVMMKMLEKVPSVFDMEQLWQLSEKARTPQVMPFGKHKGEPISSIPQGYKCWLLSQPNVDPYLARAMGGR